MNKCIVKTFYNQLLEYKDYIVCLSFKQLYIHKLTVLNIINMF